MKLSFDEIDNWKEFEDLVSAYFRKIKDAKENNLTEVQVDPSGEGSDGGRDILLTFRVDDSIRIFERKWVVQCKFHENSVSPSHLANINIPTLIHSYEAHGYLLICKKGVTSKTSELFEDLTKNCKFRYKYEFWEGNDLLGKLIVSPDLIKQYFPKYHDYLEGKNNKKYI